MAGRLLRREDGSAATGLRHERWFGAGGVCRGTEGLRGGVGGLGGADDGRVHAVADLVGEGDRCIGEAGCGELGLVLALGEGAGDAADVAAPLGPLLGGEVVSATMSLTPRSLLKLADPDWLVAQAMMR